MSKYIDIKGPLSGCDLESSVRDLSSQFEESHKILERRLHALTEMKKSKDYSVERVATEKFSLSQIPQRKTNAVNIKIPTHLCDQGVKVYSEKEANQYIPKLLNRWQEQYEEQFTSSLDAFHRALYSEMTILYVPPHTKSEEAIQIQQNLAEDTISMVIILVDDHAQVTLDDHIFSDDHQVVTGHLNSFIYLGNYSRADYNSLDTTSEETTAFIRRWGLVDQTSNLQLTIGALNDGHTIEDIHIDLIGKGAESDLRVAGISSNDQIQVVNSLVTNKADHSRGYITQRGVILDQSTLTFNGIGHIIKNAKQADNDQESRVLMLSDEARGDTNPILLIDEFEVVAGHAASIGRIDEEDLFYLTSRGLTKQLAETLFVRGFLLSQIAESLGHDKTSNWLNIFLRKLRHR